MESNLTWQGRWEMMRAAHPPGLSPSYISAPLVSHDSEIASRGRAYGYESHGGPIERGCACAVARRRDGKCQFARSAGDYEHSGAD